MARKEAYQIQEVVLLGRIEVIMEVCGCPHTINCHIIVIGATSCSFGKFVCETDKMDSVTTIILDVGIIVNFNPKIVKNLESGGAVLTELKINIKLKSKSSSYKPYFLNQKLTSIWLQL